MVNAWFVGKAVGLRANRFVSVAGGSPQRKARQFATPLPVVPPTSEGRPSSQPEKDQRAQRAQRAQRPRQFQGLIRGGVRGSVQADTMILAHLSTA